MQGLTVVCETQLKSFNGPNAFPINGKVIVCLHFNITTVIQCYDFFGSLYIAPLHNTFTLTVQLAKKF